MSTTVGSLNVDVTLELARLEAGFKELQGKTAKNMTQLKRQFRAASADADKSLGGIGKGGAGRGAIGKIGGKLAGDALGNLTGLGGRGGDMLAGAGATGGVLAGLALVFKFQSAVAGWAKESGRVDDAALSVMRYGESLTAVGKGAVDAGKSLSVNLLGALNELGEFAGSGFDAKAVNDANNSERAAVLQEQALAKLRKENDPAKLAQTRSSITSFQRDQRFAGASPKEQQDILRNEIAALNIQEAKARSSKQILEAETIRLDRLKKEAELQKNVAESTEAQRKNYEAIELAKNARLDAQDDEKRKATEAFNKKFDDDFRDIENSIYKERLDRVQKRAGSLRNPFEAGGVNGFGTASNGSIIAVQEGNRLLAESLRILKTIEENTEDALNRNGG